MGSSASCCKADSKQVLPGAPSLSTTHDKNQHATARPKDKTADKAATINKSSSSSSVASTARSCADFPASSPEECSSAATAAITSGDGSIPPDAAGSKQEQDDGPVASLDLVVIARSITSDLAPDSATALSDLPCMGAVFCAIRVFCAHAEHVRHNQAAFVHVAELIRIASQELLRTHEEARKAIGSLQRVQVFREPTLRKLEQAVQSASKLLLDFQGCGWLMRLLNAGSLRAELAAVREQLEDTIRLLDRDEIAFLRRADLYKQQQMRAPSNSHEDDARQLLALLREFVRAPPEQLPEVLPPEEAEALQRAVLERAGGRVSELKPVERQAGKAVSEWERKREVVALAVQDVDAEAMASEAASAVSMSAAALLATPTRPSQLPPLLRRPLSADHSGGKGGAAGLRDPGSPVASPLRARTGGGGGGRSALAPLGGRAGMGMAELGGEDRAGAPPAEPAPSQEEELRLVLQGADPSPQGQYGQEAASLAFQLKVAVMALATLAPPEPQKPSGPPPPPGAAGVLGGGAHTRRASAGCRAAAMLRQQLLHAGLWDLTELCEAAEAAVDLLLCRATLPGPLREALQACDSAPASLLVPLRRPRQRVTSAHATPAKSLAPLVVRQTQATAAPGGGFGAVGAGAGADKKEEQARQYVLPPLTGLPFPELPTRGSVTAAHAAQLREQVLMLRQRAVSAGDARAGQCMAWVARRRKAGVSQVVPPHRCPCSDPRVAVQLRELPGTFFVCGSHCGPRTNVFAAYDHARLDLGPKVSDEERLTQHRAGNS